MKTLKEQIMDEIKLKRDRSQELQDSIAEPDSHHDKEQEEYKADDPRELD
jgi:hypothetical protein